MVSDAIKDKYSRDIMGRKSCTSIMPCGVCRVINKAIKIYPKGYTEHLTKAVYI